MDNPAPTGAIAEQIWHDDVHPVTPNLLTVGRNRVRVEGRGEGYVISIVPSGKDPIGAVKVQHDNGTTNNYENRADLLTLLGRHLTDITPWTRVPSDEEVWATEHAGPGGLAGRAYGDGNWNTYDAKGGFDSGKTSTLADAKSKVIERLNSYGCDTSVLMK